jgi:hypothetical protein
MRTIEEAQININEEGLNENEIRIRIIEEQQEKDAESAFQNLNLLPDEQHNDALNL